MDSPISFMENFFQEFSQLWSEERQEVNLEEYIFRPIPITINHRILDIRDLILFSPELNYRKVNNALSYIYLDKNKDEFKNISSQFLASNLVVKSIGKVDNPYLKRAFELKRYLYYGGIEPRTLFHGTKKKYVDNICTYNFDWRLGGSERGHKHGKGVNFSTLPKFASIFCDKYRSKAMIMSDVLVNNTQEGHIDTVLPPQFSGTTTGKRGIILVKFYDNEFYPKYVIKFQRKQNN